MENQPENSITSDRLQEVLHACMVDAMNRYVNQVLIPEGLIDEEIWRSRPTGAGSTVCVRKHEIASDIAGGWKAALAEKLPKQ